MVADSLTATCIPCVSIKGALIEPKASTVERAKPSGANIAPTWQLG
jgi:hypothetical protein